MKKVYNRDGTIVNLVEDKELVYSEDEVDTGKVFNGKKVYRKTISIDKMGKNDIREQIYLNTSHNEVLSCSIILNWILSNQIYGGIISPIWEANDRYTRWWINSIGIYLMVIGFYSEYDGVRIIATVEYTKK